VCGLIVLAQLTLRRLRGVREVAWVGVAAVVWGWGVAQYPTVLPGSNLTLSNSATGATLNALVVLAVVVLVVVGPSFLLLFWLHGRRMLTSEDPRDST
jgi:cytochrome d ubiquinol oxidase subunit II